MHLEIYVIGELKKTFKYKAGAKDRNSKYEASITQTHLEKGARTGQSTKFRHIHYHVWQTYPHVKNQLGRKKIRISRSLSSPYDQPIRYWWQWRAFNLENHATTMEEQDQRFDALPWDPRDWSIPDPYGCSGDPLWGPSSPPFSINLWPLLHL